MAEPFGPKQLNIPLQPAGVLTCHVRTQWLQSYDREADSLTDLSYLSLGQSGAPLRERHGHPSCVLCCVRCAVCMACGCMRACVPTCRRAGRVRRARRHSETAGLRCTDQCRGGT